MKKALEEIIEDQRQALKTGEEVAARVNVLQEVSKILAKELLAEQREKNSQRVLDLEKEFEENHTAYVEKILKSIIEV